MAVLMTLETAGLAALRAGRFLFVRERWAELRPCAGIVTSNTGQYCIECCTRLASLLSPERPKSEETLIDEKHLVNSELGCVSPVLGAFLVFYSSLTECCTIRFISYGHLKPKHGREEKTVIHSAVQTRRCHFGSSITEYLSPALLRCHTGPRGVSPWPFISGPQQR